MRVSCRKRTASLMVLALGAVASVLFSSYRGTREMLSSPVTRLAQTTANTLRQERLKGPIAEQQQEGAANYPVMNNQAESDQLHQFRMWKPSDAKPKVARPRKVRFTQLENSTLSQIGQLCSLGDSHEFSKCSSGLWCSDGPDTTDYCRVIDSGCGTCVETCHSTTTRNDLDILRDKGGWCQYSAPEHQWLFEVLRVRYSVHDAQDGVPFGHPCNEVEACSAKLWCSNGNCIEKCLDTVVRESHKVDHDEAGVSSVESAIWL